MISEDIRIVLMKHIKDSDFYPYFLEIVQTKLSCCTFASRSELKQCIQSILHQENIKKELSNVIYHLLQKYPHLRSPWKPLSSQKEPIDYIRKMQFAWEKRISKSLNNICKELGIVLSRKRPLSEQKELEIKWHELSNQEPDLSQFRPVYAAKDFFDVFISLRSPNYQGFDDSRFGSYWGTIRLPWASNDINELTKSFSELLKGQLFFNSENERKLLENFDEKAKCAILARELSKRGNRVSLRAKIWSRILGVDITDKEKLYYEQLKTFVFQYDLMIDKLIYKDVKLTASNDDQYFIFQNFLLQVILLFSRDTAVLSHFTHTSASPPKALLRGKQDDVTVVYPPCGVIPFHGFSMYVAPLCYLFDDPIALYFIFREMYTRYFFRLHAVTSHHQGILALSLLFERLLQTHDEELCEHFQRNRIDPLRPAFRWLMRAFSGHLTTEQVLVLWDLILAYDNLECITVLAVAIVCFRKRSLLQVRTQSETEAVLADLSSIQVIPLITAFLTMNES